jgi:hypothetical protein
MRSAADMPLFRSALSFSLSSRLLLHSASVTKPAKDTRDFLLLGLPIEVIDKITAHIKELERKGFKLTLPKGK